MHVTLSEAETCDRAWTRFSNHPGGSQQETRWSIANQTDRGQTPVSGHLNGGFAHTAPAPRLPAADRIRSSNAAMMNRLSLAARHLLRRPDLRPGHAARRPDGRQSTTLRLFPALAGGLGYLPRQAWAGDFRLIVVRSSKHQGPRPGRRRWRTLKKATKGLGLCPLPSSSGRAKSRDGADAEVAHRISIHPLMPSAVPGGRVLISICAGSVRWVSDVLISALQRRWPWPAFAACGAALQPLTQEPISRVSAAVGFISIFGSNGDGCHLAGLLYIHRARRLEGKPARRRSSTASLTCRLRPITMMTACDRDASNSLPAATTRIGALTQRLAWRSW